MTSSVSIKSCMSSVFQRITSPKFFKHLCHWLVNLAFILLFFILVLLYLPARASEQGNVIGSVSVYIYIIIYIYMSSKKIVIERSRDLI